MYTWRVEVLLNNGKAILGFINCDMEYSEDAAALLLDSGTKNEFIAISTKLLNGKESHTFIKYGDISAITLSAPDKQD